tara:strand:- start:1040 stop:1375 length:336 start_codon:yes stop_codon:yes gene_type:complete
MVMLYVQKDGTMGPQNPVNMTNQNSTVAQANRGGPLQNQAKRNLLGVQVLTGQEASTPKEENKGANRGATGSLGTASNMGVAGTAQAGYVGSVNSEVQNDDVVLPYMKGNL